jgi:hypothetical protein
VADRPYGEIYDFYSVSPEYFGYINVIRLHISFRLKGHHLALKQEVLKM